MNKLLCSLLLSLLTLHVSFAAESDRQYAIGNYHKYMAEAKACKNAKKEASIEKFRQFYKINGHRTHSITGTSGNWKDFQKLLQSDGRFSDMLKLTPDIEITKGNRNDILKCYNRLGKIAMAYNMGEIALNDAYTDAFKKAIIYYGNIEIGRCNQSSRFHGSCFSLPTSAVNIYYFFLDEMDKVENGTVTDKLSVEACDMLKIIALQSWTQPLRNDYTDEDVSQVDRFRNHVWWVGGNGLAFRSILPTACMYKSIPMIDVLSIVGKEGIGVTSQATYNEAFWTEGFTADGAGWGHGMQCLIWGYPITGTSSALDLLSDFKGTEWERQLSENNKWALMNFLRGSNWYHYRGVWVTGVDRTSYRLSFMYNDKKISSENIVTKLLEDWQDSFTKAEVKELKQLLAEMQNYKTSNISMEGYPDGMYNGTRYFFNNDDLFKKNDNYHLMINMASARVDGLESAIDMADRYNFCTADGATLFMRSGKEYNNVLGAYDVLSYPGVTARQGMDKLIPVTNWKGYMSKHNFAAGATYGGKNAVAGYIFDKANGSEKENVNDRGNNIGKNEIIYGVQAYKSYFILDDYLVALGAGVSNSKPNMEGDIRTTLDQTEYADEVSVMDSKGNIKSVGKGKHSMFVNNAPAWVIQKGKFAYRVIEDYTKDAYFSIENRKTDWVKMNVSNKNYKGEVPATVNILQLWADHGQKPVNECYGYTVYMGDGMPSQKLPFKVLANTTKTQAVESLDGNTLEAVIYNKDSKVQGSKISVSASVPCVVLVEQGGKGKLKIAVTDPTMNEDIKEIALNINGKEINIKMNEGKFLGKPAVIML